MRNFFTLVKAQFYAFFFNGSTKRGRARTASGKGLTVVIMLAAFVFFGYVYTNMFGEILAMTENLYKLPVLMFAMCGLINFFFSFYATGSALYGTKDYDMLASFPLKTVEVVLSKLAYMFLSDLFFTVAIMTPSLFVCTKYGVAFSGTELFYIIVMALFSPLIPLSLSVIVGLIIAIISARSRHKNLVQIILSVVFLVGLFAFSFIMGMDSVNGEMFRVIEILHFTFPIQVKAIDNGLYLLLFVGISVASFSVLSFFVCKTYKRFNGILKSRKVAKNFKLGIYTGKSEKKTLLKKEFGRLFSCPPYALNSLMGAFMTILVAVVLIILRFAIGDELVALGEYISVFLPCGFFFMFVISPTTSCSVSLEGQALWIIKTSPVDFVSLFNAKLKVNDIFYLPTALIVSVAFCAFFSLEFVLSLFVVLTALSITILSGRLGLLYNILFPKLKWESETQAVKQGLSTFLTMISAFVLAGLSGVLAYFLPISAIWFNVIILAFTLILCAVIYLIIYQYGESILRKKS